LVCEKLKNEILSLFVLLISSFSESVILKLIKKFSDDDQEEVWFENNGENTLIVKNKLLEFKLEAKFFDT
jgi:hypothetical protein